MDRERAHATRASESVARLVMDGAGVDLLRAGRPLQLAHLLRRPLPGSPLHAPLPGERDRVPRTHRCGGPPVAVRRYLDEQHRDYERRLAYGNFTRDEQRRIDQTFAYLYNRYPAPARDDLNARLDEVQSAVAEIAGFTRQRQEELEQARERETALQAQPRSAAPSTAAARDSTPRRRTSRRALPTASSTC